MAVITGLYGREILDSRGMPTVEIELAGETKRARASVPSGASTGTRAAHEIRDGGTRFEGRGVRDSLARSLKEISAALQGKGFDQTSLDDALCTLDGTPNKSRLGGNVLLGVSAAFAKVSAQEAESPLWAHLAALSGSSPRMPTPACNLLNGGLHASGNFDLQECMVVPSGVTGIGKQIEAVTSIMAALKKRLQRAGLSTALGDEGGFSPVLPHNEQALELLRAAAGDAGLAAGDCPIALDAAASEWYADGHYTLHEDGVGTMYNRDELTKWYEPLVDRYHVMSIEDPFDENDMEGFTLLHERLHGRAQIVGDDLTTTNADYIEKAAAAQAIDAVIIKPNQVGTVSETLSAARAARARGLSLFVSHRSGETTDTFIADLAVGLGAEWCKFGALARGERVVKYNRLLSIAEEMHTS